MTEQTKAEQLADECDNFGHGVDPLNISVVARELRRLSPMEAECTKLMDDLFLARAQLKDREDQLESMKSPSHVHTWCTKAQADVIAEKISRLAPMEAERTKLLEVNKVLVEAFGTFFPKNACLSNDNAHDDIVITVDVTLGELRKAYSALKLAGEIK